MTPICSDSVMIPPMPLATMTDTRSPMPFRSVNCACSTASPAAATASCEKRSIRLESLRAMWSVASKPFTSPAMVVSRFSGLNAAMWSMPDTPASRFFHVESLDSPTGLTTPMPVTTMRVVMAGRPLTPTSAYRRTPRRSVDYTRPPHESKTTAQGMNLFQIGRQADIAPPPCHSELQRSGVRNLKSSLSIIRRMAIRAGLMIQPRRS